MIISNCELCPELCQNRKSIVSGYGTCKNGIMFVGESPANKGSNLTGTAFSEGKVGTFFTSCLQEVGISKEECYITSLVKCAAPNDRPPTNIEIHNCSFAYLYKETVDMNPKVIVCLGRLSSSHFIPGNVLDDSWHEIGGIKIIRIDHPGYILRVGTPEILEDYKKQLNEVAKMASIKQLKPEEYSEERKRAMGELQDETDRKAGVVKPVKVKAPRMAKVDITLEQKIEAVRMLDTGKTPSTVAEELGFRPQQVRKWKRDSLKGELV